jgi:NADH-quinone oxidoreductase subunit H
VFIWLRGTLPRLRYDQFMRFGWKVLVPTALVWILVVATMRTVSREAALDAGEVAVFVGVPIALVLLAVLLIASRMRNRDTRVAARAAAAGALNPTEPEVLPPAARAADRAAGGFPVPPMDLRVPPSPRLRSRETVAAGTVVGTGRRSDPTPQEDGDV